MKYPEGFFKEKACRHCKKTFKPEAPSSHYCSVICKKLGERNAYYVRIYGITYADVQALKKLQEDRCALCGSEGFVMNPSRHHDKLVVDHDHLTKRIRGLLCHNCNRGLGLFHDDTSVLRKAAEYVEVFRKGATTTASAGREQANGSRSARPH